MLSLRVPEPQFEGQTKTKLGNSEIEGSSIRPLAKLWAPSWRRTRRSPRSSSRRGCWPPKPVKARGALLVRTQGALSSGGMPGKLRDCTSRDVERCEIYLVEGDSAGAARGGGSGIPGAAALARQGHQRLQGARGQGPPERGNQKHHRRRRRGRRQRNGPLQAALTTRSSS